MEPETLMEAVRYFADLEICDLYMRRIKWPDGHVACPFCGSERIGEIKSRHLLRCKDCRKQFSHKVGTLMEDSPLDLGKWLAAIYGSVYHVSSVQLCAALDVTQKSAWAMLRRINTAREIAMGIEYRPIKGRAGYRVGNDGSVWTCWGNGPGAKPDRPWRQLKVRIDRDGYRRISFRDKTAEKVGPLVLTAFVGPCPDGMECCHGPNNNPADDRLENVRWDRHINNIADKRTAGTMARGDKHGKTKVTEATITEVLSLKGTCTQQQAADKFGLSRGYVGQLWSGARARVTA